jgi:hypothetical protein
MREVSTGCLSTLTQLALLVRVTVTVVESDASRVLGVVIGVGRLVSGLRRVVARSAIEVWRTGSGFRLSLSLGRNTAFTTDLRGGEVSATLTQLALLGRMTVVLSSR